MDLISKPDPDFMRLKADPKHYQQNYQYDMSSFQRRVFFAHLIKNLNDVRQSVVEIEDQKQLNQFSQRQLTYEEVPNIKYEDQVVHVTQESFDKLRQVFQQNNQTQLTPSLIFKLLINIYQSQLIFITILNALEMTMKLSFSLTLYQLFLKVTQLNDGNNLRDAYFLAVLSGILLIIAMIARDNAVFQTQILGGTLRNQLILTVFIKLSKMSQYTIKTSEVGKIINLLSNDFNVIQTKLNFLLYALVAPFTLVAAIAILVIRFGWPGLLIVFIIIFLVPFQAIVAKINGGFLEKVNIYKDKRIKTCSQIIEGIKYIKLYGWEIAFKHIIQALRRQQIKDYFKLAMGKSMEKALGILPTLLGGFICFAVMDLTGAGTGLSNAKIFSTMDLMSTLKITVMILGIGLGHYFELKVIFQRICTVINMQNKMMIQIDNQTKKPISSSMNQQVQTARGEIIFKNFNGYWNINQLTKPTLHNIDLTIKPGSFTGITGKIGSGKSGLLGCILGQIPYYSGSIFMNGSVAYVEQEPVLFSSTIKENILFGKQFSQQKYNQALQQSCLNADLQLFDEGDQTVVGERGITLSGGQKARLSFARALYSDADIYLLDDPISAVDSKVARKLYQNAIQKMKGKKTVILVTHQTSYLYGCDQIIMIEDGHITDCDTPNNLKQKLNKIQIQQSSNLQEIQPVNKNQNLLGILQKQQTKVILQKKSPTSNSNKNQQQIVKVTWKSYIKYIFYTKINYVIFPISFFLFIVNQVANAIYTRKLSQYDKQKLNATSGSGSMNDFWWTLGILVIVSFLLCLVKTFLLYMAVLNSNQEIHKNMIHGLVRSPSYYFDITPTGRLNNKFSNDLGVLDGMFPFVLVDALQGPIICIVLLLNVFSINIYFFIPGLINIVFIVIFFMYCKQVIIDVKQLDLGLKSPVFNMVSEMINGLIQIRIFNRRYTLLKQFAQKINISLRGNLCFWNLSKSFGTFVSYFTNIVVCIGWVIGIPIVTPQTAGLYAVSVVFLNQIIIYLQWFLRQIISLQSMVVSVERALIVTNLQSQKQLRTDYDQQMHIKYYDQQHQKQQQSIDKIQQSWPKHGTIILRNFSMRYRAQLPLVLKGISFEIRDKEKIGIVGRTGAGKSSIIQAIFRMCQPEQGSIYEIGEFDALKLGLHTLRQNISVIPQTPFLFKGTIKKNLDPFEKNSDQRLWQVLQQSNLKQKVEKLPDKLLCDITNASQVFSVGQKQLLCLARALLNKNKFLVLDQATSNVDMATDQYIQNCLKTKFKDTTIITIAHRLDTIADYDRVIVMDKGTIVQIGAPYELLLRKGIFADMVEHTGSNAEIIKRVAKKSYQIKR